MVARRALALGAFVAIGGCAPAPDPAASIYADQQALAQAIGNRTPGAPENCLSGASIPRIDGVGNTLVARSGDRVWVNQARNSCRAASGYDSVLVTTDPADNRYCALTLVKIVSRSTGIQQGTCVLGPWIPYR